MESFNESFQADYLYARWFMMPSEAKGFGEAWQREYNIGSLNGALGERTPSGFTGQMRGPPALTVVEAAENSLRGWHKKIAPLGLLCTLQAGLGFHVGGNESFLIALTSCVRPMESEMLVLPAPPHGLPRLSDALRCPPFKAELSMLSHVARGTEGHEVLERVVTLLAPPCLVVDLQIL